MRSEAQKTESTKTKRRFRYLFRRDSKSQQKQEDQGSKMPYQFPDISTMLPEEVDKEIILRFRSLQYRGVIDCTDPTILSHNVVSLSVATPHPSVETNKVNISQPKKATSAAKTVDRPTFKPRFFVKRRSRSS